MSEATWKQDVSREVVRKAAERARCGDIISPEEVYRVLDQWAPLTVDEAEREMDALVDTPPMPDGKVDRIVSDVMLTTAIVHADKVRRDHNGIFGVYLYLGHDGDNVCIFKDENAKEVCRGTSGRNLLDAVRRCQTARDYGVTSVEV